MDHAWKHKYLKLSHGEKPVPSLHYNVRTALVSHQDLIGLLYWLLS